MFYGYNYKSFAFELQPMSRLTIKILSLNFSCIFLGCIRSLKETYQAETEVWHILLAIRYTRYLPTCFAARNMLTLNQSRLFRLFYLVIQALTKIIPAPMMAKRGCRATWCFRLLRVMPCMLPLQAPVQCTLVLSKKKS